MTGGGSHGDGPFVCVCFFYFFFKKNATINRERKEQPIDYNVSSFPRGWRQTDSA